MMKRRWSNNGGFAALRILDDTLSEVTSSSNGLVQTSSLNISHNSLDSSVCGDTDMWLYSDTVAHYNTNPHAIITPASDCIAGLPISTSMMPVPLPLPYNIVKINGNSNSNSNSNSINSENGNGKTGRINNNKTEALDESFLNDFEKIQNSRDMNHRLLNSHRQMLQERELQPLNIAAHVNVQSNLHNNNNNNNNNNHNNNNNSNITAIHTPRSDSANSISSGRDDLSPSSSLNGFSTSDANDGKKAKKGPAPRLQEELCLVCGDRASGYHYNALTCEGCKGFFRRSVTKNAVYCCKFGHACEMDMYMRRKCQECRLKKCLTVGMRPECVVPENQCALKRREKKAQKEKDKVQTHSYPTDCIKKEMLDLMTCEPPSHPTAPLLPDDILAKCQARNIPPLTFNQLAVIYKLIWYQDGYEQPSEEDLKRIMSSPDENESQHDVSFRHITEITILTVQLIVEFAKGLPAFIKIPQEDQITLLKACSSEVMMLRMARRYDHNSDSIFFANNRSYTRDSYKMAGMADNIEDLLHFCRQMYSMKVDNVEYALLTAIVIFSDRPGLEKAQLVEAIQSYYIDTLRIYILNRHCGDPMSLVFFAKLLSILTELRTLGNQNAEMCFSLKLKNRKLPKFLEEIWDVHAIPPSVQSHIQASQAEKTMQESSAAIGTTTTTQHNVPNQSLSECRTSSSSSIHSTSPIAPVPSTSPISITTNGFAYNANDSIVNSNLTIPENSST